MPDDITDEFSDADLGDARRGRRLPEIASSLAEAPTESITAACGGWSECMAAFRLFNKGGFDPGELIRRHGRRTAGRCAAHDREVFFRVLKTGCRVERIQLKSGEALIRALMIHQVIAWRILYLTHLGRCRPELPCGRVFDEAEWKSACAVVKRPAEAGEPSLAEFIGGLGGHRGRKRDGEPGAQVIWRG